MVTPQKPKLLRAVRGYSYKMQEIVVLWGSDVAQNWLLYRTLIIKVAGIWHLLVGWLVNDEFEGSGRKG
jgi:hypothetical protein